MHITHYIDEKFYGNVLINHPYWQNFVIEGGNGVSLFFVISGFILSLPFAKWRLQQTKKICLKQYYVKRLTRLEPPYIIVLILCFIAHVWVLHKYTFTELLPHFFASVLYLHTIIYDSFSFVLPVAWSLEIEVQFYVLAPLLCSVYLIKPNSVRWGLFILIIVASAVYWFDVWEIGTVVMFLHYFFCGMFIADMYCSKKALVKNEEVGFLVGGVALLIFLFMPSLHLMAGYLIKMISIFLLVHLTLTNRYLKKIFSLHFMALIGGMCYSIYLLHFAIISFVGRMLIENGVNPVSKSYYIPLALSLIFSVLLLSSIYFIAIEKPFMKWIGFRKNRV
jgi:peptidoglycan/LPS O-acetylase OafA/YrhL